MRLPRKPDVLQYLYPGEVLDYAFDFVDHLAVGDTIASSTVTILPVTGLTLGTKSQATPIVTQWVTAVTAGRYMLQCEVVTTGGRTHRLYAVFPVAVTPTA